MRKTMLSVIVLAVALVVWLLAGRWVASGSERFYLLVPPVFLALYVVQAPEGWRGLGPHVRPASRYLAGLAVFGTLCYIGQTAVLLPGHLSMVVRGFQPGEWLVTLYFLVAVSLLIVVPLQALKWLCRQSADRFIGPGPDQAKHPVLQSVVRDVMPAALLVPILLPYLLGAMYVHRLKISNPASPQELLGRQYEDVAFQTADGLTIRGWFIPTSRPSPRTVIICHGLGANRSNFIQLHRVGDALEANVLMFDFRGHGDSEGHTVSFGYYERLDVLAAADFLRRDKPEQSHQLIGLGISMGASALAQAAAEIDTPFDAVILDSCFASAVELTDQVLNGFPPFVRPLLALPGVPLASLHAGCNMESVRPIDRVASIRSPLLFIHARKDSLIPSTHSERLYEQAGGIKRIWIPDSGEHGSAWLMQEAYLNKVKEIAAVQEFVQGRD